MALTIDEKIEQAETAYHELMTGRLARVYVDRNGERIEYTSANAGRLRAYIESLKNEKNSKSRYPMKPLM